MRKTAIGAAMLSLAWLGTGAVQAANGAVGDRLDSAIFCQQARATASDDAPAATLVVLAPARSEYDGMLRLAFDRYFREAKAFGESVPAGAIRVLHVTGVAAETSLLVFPPRNDCEAPVEAVALAEITKATGVTLPRDDDADATVLLLDRQGVVRWRDDAYRAQGEHLKPLEAAVKALFGRHDSIADVAVAAPLKIGDAAPDFPLEFAPTHTSLLSGDAPHLRLSDLRGKVVLLSFYPAAFSGTLPKIDGTVSARVANERDFEARRMMMCSIQLTEMDRVLPHEALEKQDVVTLAISAPTPALLRDWANTLGTRELTYLNDPGYAIAQRYGSFDTRGGYDLRKVYIVGRDGRIAYVDDDYTVDDAKPLAAKLAEIAKR